MSHFDMTERFTIDANGFIRSANKKKKPFFLYFALAQTHVNLFNNPGFVGSSVRGMYLTKEAKTCPTKLR